MVEPEQWTPSNHELPLHVITEPVLQYYNITVLQYYRAEPRIISNVQSTLGIRQDVRPSMIVDAIRGNALDAFVVVCKPR